MNRLLTGFNTKELKIEKENLEVKRGSIDLTWAPTGGELGQRSEGPLTIDSNLQQSFDTIPVGAMETERAMRLQVWVVVTMVLALVGGGSYPLPTGGLGLLPR